MFEVIIATYCIVPVSLVLSLIQVESSGRPTAFSQGNYGLMQVRFATAKELSCGVEKPEDLFTAETNIHCGCNYLNKQFKRYKNIKATLVAYNQGSVFLDGKIVMNHEGLTEKALEGVDRNIYANKILNRLIK